MLEKKIYNGAFWIPNHNYPQLNTNEVIYGYLTYDPVEGIELVLMGLIGENFKESATHSFYILLHGISTDGHKLTLSSCRSTRIQTTTGGLPTHTFKIEKILEGELFYDTTEINFDKINLEYTNLHEWLNKSGFNPQIDNCKLKDKINRYDLAYETPDTIQLFKSNKIDINFKFSIDGILLKSGPIKNINLTQKAYVEVIHNSENSFNDYLKTIEKIRKFLTIAYLDKVFIIKLVGYIKNEDDRLLNINIFYSQSYYGGKINNLDKNDLFFCFNDIQNLSGVFSQFMKSIDVLNPIYNLYLTTIYNYGNYIEQNFLAYIQSIDSMIEYRKGKKTNFENDLLKKFNAHSDCFEKLTEYHKDFQNLSKVIKNSRDFYTHRYKQSNKKEILKPNELITINIVLKILIEIEFLSLFGFSIDVIINLIIRKYKNNFFKDSK